MIVVCTTCQARFKVADEKIGPRGAKVRCSKCQTVFIIHRDLGVMPAEEPPAPPPAHPRRPGPGELDLESEPMSGTRPSGFIADPFSRNAAPAPSPAADPFDAQSPAPATSPFGAAHDPFGGADPFGAQPPTVGGHEGFATSGASLGAVDPFVATVSGPSHGLPTSAVTDLSDLIGGGARGAAPQGPAATPPPEPSGILETGFDFDPSAPAPELEVAQPPPPSQPPVMDAPEPDLALAERTPTTGVPVHGAPSIPMPGADGFGGLDPFSGPTSMGSSAPLDFGGPDEEFGMGPDLVEPPPHPAPAPPPPPEPLELAPAAPEPPPVESPELAAPEQAAAGLRRRSSRLRAVVINAISLAALLIVAVALLAFWRGVRPGAGGLLRPATLFGSAGAQQAPFTAAQLRSGLYDRADAAPVLFVTGSAVSHAASAVPGLRVRVELVKQGAVVAQGEARAGAVPTPEELYGSKDAAGIAAVLDRLAARAPHGVKPGDAVPFLVAINDFPPDVTGVGLRVTIEPIGGDGAKGEPGR